VTDYRDLTQSSTLLREIIESAPVALVMIDCDGCIVLINAEAETLFGYRRDELLGRTVEDLIPIRFRGLHPAFRTGFFAEPQSRRMGVGRELFGLRNDGSEFPIEIGLKPIRTNDRLFVLSAIVNLTQRKLLEARFRATVESAPMAMVMIDQGGLIVLVNAETEKLFGYARAELLQRSIEVLVPERFQVGHPKLREGFFRYPEARRMGAGRDLYAARKDGSEFPVEIGLNPVETEEGTFVLSAIVDITDRQRNAQQLKNALAEKTVLLNEVHHRVKNNLQIISGLLHLQAAEAKHPELRELLVQSLSRVQSMSLIHQLLYEGHDYSSIRLDLYFLRLADLLWGSYLGLGATASLVPDLDPVTVTISQAIPVGLLVNELLTNALKHAHASTISLTLRHAADDAGISIRVADNGSGFPVGVNIATARTLGLTLANQLADQLGAKLQNIEVSEGVSLLLQFPLNPEEPA